MILNGLICQNGAQIQLAANAKIQAINFALCLAAGLVCGIFALLYFRRSSRAEIFVTDLFATLAIGGGYIGCFEILFDGRFEMYGLVAYLAGVAVVPSLFKIAKHISKTQHKQENNS